MADQPVADHRMLLDVCRLLRRQPAGLLQHVVADADLADVVQEARQVEVALHGRRHVHLPGQPHRHPRHALAVAPGVRVLGVDGGRQAAHQAEKRVFEFLIDLGLLAVVEQLPPGQQHQFEVHRLEAPARMEAQSGQPVAARPADAHQDRAERPRRGRLGRGVEERPQHLAGAGGVGQDVFDEALPPRRRQLGHADALRPVAGGAGVPEDRVGPQGLLH